MSKRLQLRAHPSTSPVSDTKAKQLLGVQVMAAGEATGHGMLIDGTTLDKVVELGNAATSGIKARWDHPLLCERTLGSFLGIHQNFRRVDDTVLSDFEFSDAADQKHVDHILEMADKHPEHIGLSVCITCDLEDQKDGEGNPIVDGEGNKPLPYVRVNQLFAVDFVDDGAATDGLFAEPIDGVQFSSREMVKVRELLGNESFIKRALTILQDKAVVLGIDTKPLESPTPDQPSDEKSRIKSILAAAKNRPHLSEPCTEFPDGLLQHAIEHDMSTTAFMEHALDASDRHRELSLLQSGDDELADIGSAPPFEPGKTSGFQSASLSETFFSRFKNLGYSDEQARTMAASAAQH